MVMESEDFFEQNTIMRKWAQQVIIYIPLRAHGHVCSSPWFLAHVVREQRLIQVQSPLQPPLGHFWFHHGARIAVRKLRMAYGHMEKDEEWPRE
jgi:hypothetical protein